jgi:hypothetical protein
LFGALSLLPSCGGGGGGGGETTPPPSAPMSYEGSYEGAVSAGDFALINIKGNTLTYKIEGPVFGNLTGSKTLVPLTTDANEHFWKSSDDSWYAFLSGNVGFFVVPEVKTVNGETEPAIIVGLKDLGPNDLIDYGESFVYASVRTDSLDLCEITVNADNTADVNCLLSNVNGTVCWKLDNQNNRVLISDGNVTDCANWDGKTNLMGYVYVKKPGHRDMFVFDYADGKGIGVGAEKTEVSLPTDVEYETLDYCDDGVVPATVHIYYNSTSGQTEYTWTSECWSGRGVLEANCFYDSEGNKYNATGWYCAHNLDSGNYWNIIVDVDDGYYIAVSADGEYLEIGGAK